MYRNANTNIHLFLKIKFKSQNMPRTIDWTSTNVNKCNAYNCLTASHSKHITYTGRLLIFVNKQQ